MVAGVTDPHASHPHEAIHGEDNQEAEAQDIRPERQQESQDYGGHTVVPERLLYKELKSSADEEQQAGTSNTPSCPLELSVLPSLAIHKIITGYGSEHGMGDRVQRVLLLFIDPRI